MATKGLSASEKKEIMSDGLEDTGSSDSVKKSKTGIVIAVILILLCGAGAGLYFAGMIPGGLQMGKTDVANDNEGAVKDADHGENAKSEGGHGEKMAGKAAGDGKGPIFFSFPNTPENPGTFTANLNTGGKQPVFLNMEVALELPGASDLEAVNANLPRIQDMFNTYLRELRPSDLQGSSGIYRLREELLLRVNKAIAPAKVSDILFKKIVVQ